MGKNHCMSNEIDEEHEFIDSQMLSWMSLSDRLLENLTSLSEKIQINPDYHQAPLPEIPLADRSDLIEKLSENPIQFSPSSEKLFRDLKAQIIPDHPEALSVELQDLDYIYEPSSPFTHGLSHISPSAPPLLDCDVNKELPLVPVDDAEQ